jgi:hypothetical protein
MQKINWNPPVSQLRLFGGLWLPLFLGVLGGLWLWRHGESWLPISLGLWAAAVLSLAVGWLAPAWLRWVFVGMIVVTYPIGWVVSHVLLAIVFYGILTPLGLIMRLTGRDPLHRQFDRTANTYWTRWKPPANKARYFRQY